MASMGMRALSGPELDSHVLPCAQTCEPFRNRDGRAAGTASCTPRATKSSFSHTHHRFKCIQHFGATHGMLAGLQPHALSPCMSHGLSGSWKKPEAHVLAVQWWIGRSTMVITIMAYLDLASWPSYWCQWFQPHVEVADSDRSESRGNSYSVL